MLLVECLTREGRVQVAQTWGEAPVLSALEAAREREAQAEADRARFGMELHSDEADAVAIALGAERIWRREKKNEQLELDIKVRRGSWRGGRRW